MAYVSKAKPWVVCPMAHAGYLRLRNMLRKALSKVTDVDLNEIARNTILILSPLANARKFDVKTFFLRSATDQGR
jgi:hypothetical protein